MSISKNNRIIKSLPEWETFAGPKIKNQWTDERSAKEFARAWLASGEQLPPEVAAALISHPSFGAVHEWQAEPEAKLRFDNFPGEPRNSDLAVHARDAFGCFLLAVEAKADESYGETVARTIEVAKARSQRSKVPNRVQQLTDALFGACSITELRYQLLTASAGALCEAERKRCSRAVLLIHEFATNKTTDTKHHQNARDLQSFLNALAPDTCAEIADGKLYGPFSVPDDKLRHIEFYIGKVVRNLRTNSLGHM